MKVHSSLLASPYHSHHNNACEDSGLYVTCNLSTGALGSDAEKPDRAELGSSMTSFLDSFHGWGLSQ